MDQKQIEALIKKEIHTYRGGGGGSYTPPKGLVFAPQFARGGIVGKYADMLILDDIVENAEKKVKNKLAPVAPYHIYQQFSVNNYIPEVILLLAHDVVDKKDEYKETFDDPRWTNCTIIMDNSLVELKSSVDIEMVKEAVEIVGADVVVLPDVMGSGAESAAVIIDAWQDWRYTFRDEDLMAVLHGPSVGEMVKCAEDILKYGVNPNWISIPRITEKGNMERLTHINVARAYFPNAPIHLLGFSDFPWCDVFAAKHPKVKSIDSAVPVRAPKDWRLTGTLEPRDPKWFENAVFSLDMIENCRYVDKLINS